MLIKVYTTDDVLHIIDSAYDIVTYPKEASYITTEEESSLLAYDSPLVFDKEGVTWRDPLIYELVNGGVIGEDMQVNNNIVKVPCRVIDYRDRDGYARRIAILAKAYICTDGGVTIEVVKV